MPTIVQTFQGRVTGLWGHALVRGKDGKMHPLQINDIVHKGDVILTSQDGIVQLTPDDGAAHAAHATQAAAAAPDIDRVITDLNQPDSTDATAAGLNGGDGAGDLLPGLRVARISESVTPAGLTLPVYEGVPRDEPRHGGELGASEQTQQPTTNPPIDADSTTIHATEQGPAVSLGLTAPTGIDGLAVVTVTQLPAVGQLLKADGTPVALGSALTVTELTGLKYLPPADHDGSAPVGSFGYTVSDHGQTVSGGTAIDLGTANVAPVGHPDTASTPEATPVSGNLLANDTDANGDTLHITQYTIDGVTHAAGSGASMPGVGSLVVNDDGSYTYTPAPGYSGTLAPITYTLTDGTVTSTSTLAITVTPVNHAPVAIDDIASTPINISITVPVLANDKDADGDPLTVTGATLADPAAGTVTVNPDGTLTLTPTANYAGPVVIGYTVSDGHGGTDAATVTVNVGANTPPTGADSAHTIAEDTSYVVQTTDFGFADADAGQTFANVRIDTLPSAGALWVDGVAVHVGEVISAADIAAGKLVFVPAADGNGAPYASFGFSVQDSASAFDATSNTLTIDVTPVNDAPVAHADVATTLEDTPATGNVLANDTDVDGDGLHVTQFSIGGTTYAAGATATLAGVGTLTIGSDGAYTFTPAANYNGAVPVATYTVTDGALTSDSTLTIGVTPVNDAPVAHADVATTLEDTPATGNVITNDTDVDGDALHVTQFSIGGTTYAAGTTATLAGVGTLTIGSDGAYTFTAAANYNGSVPVATYTITDGALTSDSTLTLSVTPVNDAPVAHADVATTLEDTPATGNVLANDTDVDGDLLARQKIVVDH